MGRLAQIVNVFARHGFWTVFDAAGVRSWLTPEQVKTAEEISRVEGAPDESENLAATIEAGTKGMPARVRAAFEELGPAFVKLGQMLASRQDLLPEAYINEFRKLHQNVASLPFKAIKAVIDEELGSERVKEFAFIDEKPLAAGSIGQVHSAELKDGRRVVIKVQRPNIYEPMQTDLSLMEVLAGLLEKYIPESKTARPRLIAEEFSRGMLGELDFVREAGNTSKVRENFAGSAYIKIPEVFWDLTTSKVITLSYLDGFEISNKKSLIQAGLDPAILVERGLSAFLQMVFVDGFYHGDLHAGNLLALPDNHVGIIDFGLTIRLGRNTREHLAGLLVALVDEDYEALVSHFVELADPIPSFNVDLFAEEVANALTPFIGLKLAQIPTARLLWDIAKIAADRGAPLPRQMVSYFRTLASFEGVGTALDPTFDIISVSQRFSHELVKHMYSPEALRRQGLIIARDFANLAKHAPRQMRGLLKTALDGDLKLNIQSEDLKYAAYSLDRLASRVSVSIIVASLVIGSSILILAKVGMEYYHMSYFGLIGFSIAGILGLYVVWSIFRGGGGKF